MPDKIKLVANTSPRGINVTYIEKSGTYSSFFIAPGLNRIPDDKLKLMLKQKAFKELLDNGTLAANKNDINRGRDVEKMVKAGQGTTQKLKPERPPNSNDKGADLHSSDIGAADTDEKGKKAKKKK